MDDVEGFDKNKPESKLKVKSSRRRKIGAQAPRIFRILLFGSLVIAIVTLLLLSGLFDLDEVDVTDPIGNQLQNSNTNYIRSLVEEEYLGKNFFFSDPNEIKQKLINADPYIDSLWVEKIAPRKLHVFIEEKVPEMYVQFENTCLLIDSENDFITQYPIISEEESELAVECSVEAGKDGVLFVNFMGDHYEFIIKDNEFFLYDQIQHTRNMLDSYGVEVSSVVVGDRLLTFETSDQKYILIDPFDQFEIQLKRIVLILNQIKWADQDFIELDVRYKRPVLRNQRSG